MDGPRSRDAAQGAGRHRAVGHVFAFILEQIQPGDISALL